VNERFGVSFRDRPEAGRHEVLLDGQVAGFTEYELGDGVITFIHTEVDPAFAGHGLASQLAAHVLADARSRRLRVRPRCPFIHRFIREHPEFADVTRAVPAAGS
jgi:uncharacterized protein